MKHAGRYKAFFLSTAIAFMPAFISAGEDTIVQDSTTLPIQEDMPKISESFGHLIGKNLDSLGMNFDMKLVVKGIEDFFAGTDAPMSEGDCIQAITLMQEQAFQEQSENNLRKAEEFLSVKSQEKDIVVLEEGKLQYRQIKQGSGEKVEENCTPLIRYVGRFIDDKIFGESTEDQPVSLSDTIPGFQKAIVGMQEGETREVYIHPDLAYGNNSGYGYGDMPPNSLLKFEIEIVRANVPKAEEEALSAASASKQQLEEIAVHEQAECSDATLK